MAAKDITEKTLLGFNDVFADVVNTFFALSGINRRIDPDELEDVRAWSMYKAEDKLREQERDVVKLWKPGGVVISLIGLENQSDVDSDMPLRIFGYEGADYRGQLSRKGTKPGLSNKLCMRLGLSSKLCMRFSYATFGKRFAYLT